MKGVNIKWHNVSTTLVVVKGCWLLTKEISKRKILVWGHPLLVHNKAEVVVTVKVFAVDGEYQGHIQSSHDPLTRTEDKKCSRQW